ncbi:MAG: IclR family transcriptional regulator [Oscillospiraceae bacterium]|nr:IclR family transcriptional regulator [Oscillospiraceae bacterium]
MPKEGAEKSSVQSLERTFAILEELAKNQKGLGLTELANTVGLHKSTVHRLLASLSSLGYVVKDSFTGSYRLTFKMLELSNHMLAEMDILSVSKPHLDKLSADTGESIHLVLPDTTSIVYIYKTDASNRSFRMTSQIGKRMPMYCSAVGKSMLSTFSKTEVQNIWNNSKIKALTPYTITDFATLEAQLCDIRRRGYAIDEQENELGVRCIGAAITDYTGRAIAALSLSAPVVRMSDERIQQLQVQLLHTRNNICHDMGY